MRDSLQRVQGDHQVDCGVIASMRYQVPCERLKGGETTLALIELCQDLHGAPVAESAAGDSAGTLGGDGVEDQLETAGGRRAPQDAEGLAELVDIEYRGVGYHDVTQ